MKRKLVITFIVAAAIVLIVVLNFSFTDKQAKAITETARENVLTHMDGIIKAALCVNRVDYIGHLDCLSF